MLRGLEGQTWPVHRLIVMNTGKENWKEAYENDDSDGSAPSEREEFDHGKTRDQAARMSRADYLLFMTQDALPEDCHLIESWWRRWNGMKKSELPYARQLPQEDCRLMERIRDSLIIRRKPDGNGWQTCRNSVSRRFLFNVCAMYRPGSCICSWVVCTEGHFNEDMIFAGRTDPKGIWSGLCGRGKGGTFPQLLRQSAVSPEL